MTDSVIKCQDSISDDSFCNPLGVPRILTSTMMILTSRRDRDGVVAELLRAGEAKL